MLGSWDLLNWVRAAVHWALNCLCRKGLFKVNNDWNNLSRKSVSAEGSFFLWSNFWCKWNPEKKNMEFLGLSLHLFCIYNWIFVPHKTFIIKQDKNLNEGEDIVFILMMISFSFIYSLTSVMFSLSVFSGLVFSSGIFWWAFFFWLVVFCFSVAPWSSILILVWYFWVSNDLQEACLLYWTAVF